MTPSQLWSWARWPVAILALLLVVRYAAPRALDAIGGTVSFSAEEGSAFDLSPTETATGAGTPTQTPTPTPTLEAPGGAVSDGSAEPLADFSVTERVANSPTEPVLTLGDDPGDSIILAFPLVEGAPSCVAEMALSLSVTASTGDVELGLFLADVPNAELISQFQEVTDSDRGFLLTAEPTASALVGSPGRLEVDVLGAYQELFRGGAAPDTPFVLALVATSDVPAQGSVEIAASEDPLDNGPRLSWTGAADCG